MNRKTTRNAFFEPSDSFPKSVSLRGKKTKRAKTQKPAHRKSHIGNRTSEIEKASGYCDFDHECRETPRRLDLGNGAGLFLCKHHFYQEANSDPRRFLGQIWENAEEYSGE